MSLKQIALSPETLAQLYTLPIIDMQTTNTNTSTTIPSESIKFLGNNQKKITILVKADDAPYLNDKIFTFLTGILGACKLSMADIALINISSQNNSSYSSINSVTKPEKAILFDVSPQEIALPLQFPRFQIQGFNNVMYLSAPGLPAIEADKAIKTQLWVSLKQLFQL